MDHDTKAQAERLVREYGSLEAGIDAEFCESEEKKPLSIEEVRNNLLRISTLTADETYETIRGLYHNNAAAIDSKQEKKPFHAREKMKLFREGNKEGIEKWKR